MSEEPRKRAPWGSLKRLTPKELAAHAKALAIERFAANPDKMRANKIAARRVRLRRSKEGILSPRRVNALMSTNEVKTLRAIDTAVRQAGASGIGHNGAAGLGEGCYWKRAKHLAW